MKNVLLFTICLCMGMGLSAQFNANLKKHAKAVAPASMSNVTGFETPVMGLKPPVSAIPHKSVQDDPVTATTRYDVQSNGAAPERCYLYPDGTIGTASIWSAQNASWTDRGTGYNYFDGTNWGAQPAARVETIRTGWPNYRPFGPTGELIISHEATGPLVMNTRSVKGTGAWTQTLLPSLPSQIPMIFWPRVVTNGTDHMNIHVIALTGPTGSGGVLYNGMDGALVYSRSLDGGATWSDWSQPADLNSTNYAGFGSDTYAWAEPKGDTLAFTLGGGFYDQLLLKSTDNGATWTKTVIYHSPYNLGGSSPNYFNAPDGASAIALDNQGMAHVIFGLTYDSGTNTAWYYNIFAQGVVYWNEYQPELRQDLDPDSLFTTGNLVGWVKDTNVLHLPATQIAFWSKSLTSFPDLVIDECNYIFPIFAGATSLLDPNNFDLRHIFARKGIIYNHQIIWDDSLTDINSDFVQYNFSECMYPSVSPTPVNDNYLYILFQKDDYAGSYVLSTLATGTWQGQSAPDDNSMILIKMAKPFPPCHYIGFEEKQEKSTFSVSQNVPNPFNGLTEVKVYHQNSGDLSIKITNVMGQTLMTQRKTGVLPGVSQFEIDGSKLAPGVYFYTVRQGDQAVTKKMVIE